MSEALELLVNLLDLERIEVNTFRGRHPEEERQRTFGGQVAAQALMAAGRTVEFGSVHSLHSYFLRPGDPKIPILYEVDRIRDGRSFTTRRVVAIQHGKAIYNMQASFHSEEESIEHQFAMPDVPAPETIGRLADRIQDGGGDIDEWFKRQHPIDQRFVGELPWSPTRSKDFMGASLDHCMWFHRPFRADEWLLYDTDSPIAHGGRGLARGFLFNEAGQLMISMVQEGLTRIVDPSKVKS